MRVDAARHAGRCTASRARSSRPLPARLAGRRWIEARRSSAASGVAEVATAAVAAHDPPQIVAGARGVALELPPERPDLLAPGVRPRHPSRCRAPRSRPAGPRRSSPRTSCTHARPRSPRCASDAATAASPTSSANAGTRRLQRSRAVVGLKASSASGWSAESAASSSRRIAPALAQSGYGTSGCATIASPPCSWTCATLARSDCQGRMRSRRKRPTRWPLRVEISSPDDDLEREVGLAPPWTVPPPRRRSARGR